MKFFNLISMPRRTIEEIGKYDMPLAIKGNEIKYASQQGEIYLTPYDEDTILQRDCDSLE